MSEESHGLGNEAMLEMLNGEMRRSRTRDRFRALLADVEFRDWTLALEEDGTSLYLQWSFYAADSDDPREVGIQKCRKWRVSYHAADAEVVQTAWAAALMAVEHEAREDFKYRGRRIYGPHQSLEALMTGSLDVDVRS